MLYVSLFPEIQSLPTRSTRFSFFALPSAALGLGVRDIFANGSFTRFWRCYIVIMERASWSGAAPNEAFIF